MATQFYKKENPNYEDHTQTYLQQSINNREQFYRARNESKD